MNKLISVVIPTFNCENLMRDCLESVKKQNYITVMSFFRFIILAVTIFPLVIKFGIIGAGYAVLLSVFGEIPVVLYCAYRVFKKELK